MNFMIGSDSSTFYLTDLKSPLQNFDQVGNTRIITLGFRIKRSPHIAFLGTLEPGGLIQGNVGP